MSTPLGFQVWGLWFRISLGIGLRQGPRGALLLVSEVPL